MIITNGSLTNHHSGSYRVIGHDHLVEEGGDRVEGSSHDTCRDTGGGGVVTAADSQSESRHFRLFLSELLLKGRAALIGCCLVTESGSFGSSESSVWSCRGEMHHGTALSTLAWMLAASLQLLALSDVSFGPPPRSEVELNVV